MFLVEIETGNGQESGTESQRATAQETGSTSQQSGQETTGAQSGRGRTTEGSGSKSSR